MTTFEIPLSPEPQRFSISLVGTTYQMAVHWCRPSNCWILDIATSDGEPLLSGVPLITGANLLSQFGYVGIPGALVVQTDHDADAVPTFDNLGKTGHLYFVTTP